MTYANESSSLIYNETELSNAGMRPPQISIGWASSEEGVSLYFVVFFPLLSIVLILSKFLHDRPVLSAFLPEVGMTVIVGIFAGLFVRATIGSNFAHSANNDDIHYSPVDAAEEGVANGLLAFSPTFFFSALLPPIIFNSGYHINRGAYNIIFLNLYIFETKDRNNGFLILTPPLPPSFPLVESPRCD
jgi:hypothetical protein